MRINDLLKVYLYSPFDAQIKKQSAVKSQVRSYRVTSDSKYSSVIIDVQLIQQMFPHGGPECVHVCV